MKNPMKQKKIKGWRTGIAFLLLLLWGGMAVAQAESVEKLFQQAVALDKDGFLEEAAQAWEKVLASNPERNRRVYASLKLSSTAFKLSDFDKAIETAGKLAGMEPDNFDAQFHLANALAGIRRYPKAIEAYRKTVQLRPDEGLGLVGLGLCLFANGDPKSAIEKLKEAKSIFKKKKNISWYRDTRIMIPQINHFSRFPPNFADLWLKNSLKLVRDTYEKAILDLDELMQ